MKNKKSNTNTYLFFSCLLLFLIANSIQLKAQDPLVITEDGNVGIGTDIPNRNLTIYGEDRAYLNTKTKTGYEFLMGIDAGGGIISTMSNHDLQLRAGGNSVKMIIKSSGKIGIGIRDPGVYKLNVNGSVKALLLNVETQVNAASATFTDNAQINNAVIGDVGYGPDYAGFVHENVEGRNQYALLQKRDGLYTLINKKLGDGWIGFRINNSDKMVVHNNGNVGIGDTNPTQGRLVVKGGPKYVLDIYKPAIEMQVALKQGTRENLNAQFERTYSAYFGQSILYKSAHEHSDARIKINQGISDGFKDLNILKNIEITNYQLKDRIANGNRVHKKVIAQQVKQFYPQAVTLSTNEIPDIYQFVTIENGWVDLATDLKLGEKVQLIFGSDRELFEVLEVSPNGFKIKTDRNGDAFVYGRQVNDFHNVDYDAIAMLNVSATQELIRRIEQLEKEKAKLQTQNKSLSSEVTNILERLQKIETSLQQ